MSTAFLSIADGIAAALAAAHPGVPVQSNRTRPISERETRALVVRLQATRRDTEGPLGATDWRTIVLIECMARGSTGADPAQALDALLASAWAALLSTPLQLPDVMDIDAEPDIAWDYDAAETPVAAAAFRLVVRHRTQLNTLTSWSASP